MQNRQIDMIGAAFGLGGKYHEPYFAVQTLEDRGLIKTLQQRAPTIQWSCRLTESPPDVKQIGYPNRVEAVWAFNGILVEKIITSVSQHHFPIVIGGDHTIAIGTWSGVVSALDAFQEFGLIWIDAHMDAHTPQTTESQALCGMPVAVLMGYGETLLTKLHQARAKLDPRHIVLIGVRSFEAGEAELLKQLNVTVYFMSDVKKSGFQAVFEKAIAQVTKGTKGFGISIDLDAFDPIFAPGVGYPEPDGLEPKDVLTALKSLKENSNFKALEIAEYNPQKDIDYKTVQLIENLIECLL